MLARSEKKLVVQMLFSSPPMETRICWHRKVKVKFLPYVTRVHVTLGQVEPGERQYTYQSIRLVTSLTRALLGGGEGLNTHTPCGFSRTAKKRRREALPFFCVPYQPSISHLFRKICSQVISGQVTKSGQVTLPSKKNYDAKLVATVLERSI